MRLVVLSVVAAIILALQANFARGLTYSSPEFVNFETMPSLPTGPSVFSSAGAAQTVAVPGIATFSGGVVLGNETLTPALSYVTPPNDYATATNSYVGSTGTLGPAITITVDPAYTCDEVSFTLLNGYTSAQTYTVDAFNGSTMVSSQTLPNVPANTASGFDLVDLTAPQITSVTVNPPDSTTWDYAIDSVALNQTVQTGYQNQAAPPTVTPIVPLPQSFWSGLSVLIGLGIVARARHTRRAGCSFI